MYDTVKSESVFFLLCIGAGIAAAFTYDLLRISRRIIKKGSAVICGEDILFIFALSLLCYSVAYAKNYGKVQLHGFLGTAFGVTAYALVFRNRIVDMGEYIAVKLIKIFIRCVKVITFPICLLSRILKKPVRIIAWYTGRGVRSILGRIRSIGTRLGIRLKNIRLFVRKK